MKSEKLFLKSSHFLHTLTSKFSVRPVQYWKCIRIFYVNNAVLKQQYEVGDAGG